MEQGNCLDSTLVSARQEARGAIDEPGLDAAVAALLTREAASSTAHYTPSLPKPASAEAKALFRTACTETDRLAHDTVHGYPMLKRTGMELWTRHALDFALEAGEIAPARYAALYPLAFEVIDGQHSAIAAATHPDIDVIPVIVVDAESKADRAGAFIGHNRDRVAITPAQMHVAAVAAGDPDAIEAERLCALVGVQILRMPPARAVYRPRQTIAASTVRWLVATEEEIDATYILRTLAEAELAPITAAQIRALVHLITAEEFEGLDREALARTIQALGIKATEQEAKEHCATHYVPLHRGLASVWFTPRRFQRQHRACPIRAAGPSV